MKLNSSKKWAIAATAAFLSLGAYAPGAMAADHRDSLAVDAIPEGDFTDVFSFVDPANNNNVVLVMSVNPFTSPSEAPSIRFGEDLLYQMKIDNNPANGPAEDLVIQVEFHSTNRGAQTYTATLGTPSQVGPRNRRLNGGTQLCTPANGGNPAVYVGSAGSGVTKAQATVATTLGGQCFAGLEDDSFQTDVAQAVFRIGLNPDKAANATNHTQDLFRGYGGLQSLIGGLRGRPLRLDGTSGSDGFGGFDTSIVAISVPKSLLRGSGIRDVRTGNVNSSLVGIWGTVSRPTSETFDGFSSTESDDYAQFERMGQQLFNTVFIFQQPVVNGGARLTAGDFANRLAPGQSLPGSQTRVLGTAELKDLNNAIGPESDFALFDRFFPDSLTTTSTASPSGGGLLGGLLGTLSQTLFGGGNTVSARASLLTLLGFNSVAVTGTPLLLPQVGLQNNTNSRLNAQLSIPDYMRLNLDQATDGVRPGAATAGTSSPTLAVGQWGLQNGRRPADDVTDIVLRLNRELDDVKFTDNLVLPGLVNVVPGAGPLGSRRALNCNELALAGGDGLVGVLNTLTGGVNALLQGGASDGLLGKYQIQVLTPCEDARIFAVLQGTDWIESNPQDVINVANQVSNEGPLTSTFPYYGVNPVPGEPGTHEFPAQQ